MANYFVVGSNSFSGSAFINSALNLGHNVIGISRSSEISHEFSSYFKNLNLLNYKFVQLDINTNCKSIIDLIQNSKSQVIVNFAAQSMVGQSWQTPEDWYETNTVGFSKLIQGIYKFPFITKFIQFTTPEVYGSTKNWVKESFDFAPTTPYAISRAASDWHLRAYFENYNFPVIFTRAANVYGAHQQLYRIIPKTIVSILKGNKLPLHGGGKSLRSFIHIRDVTDALQIIIEKGEIGQSYHISSLDTISIRNLVDLIGSKLGVDINNFIEVESDRTGKDFAYMLDSTKIRQELNWRDQVTVNEGVDETILWVKENFNTLSKLPTEYSHKK